MSWLLIGLLSAVLYQDFRERAIYAFLPVLLLFFAPAKQFYQLGYIQYGFIGFNLLLLSLQLVALQLYFLLKNARLYSIVNHEIGLGDLLFFLPLCCLFSPLQFIFFFIISLAGSLIAYLLFSSLLGWSKECIPLAGSMSAFLIFYLLLEQWTSFSMYNDSFFYQWIG